MKKLSKILGLAMSGLMMLGAAVGIKPMASANAGTASQNGSINDSWDLTSSSSDFTSSNCETYFTQPYGMKKANAYIQTVTLEDSVSRVDFDNWSNIKIKIGIKCLQNGASTSKLTVTLLDSKGSVINDSNPANVVLTPKNASSASNTDYSYADFDLTDNVCGFRVQCTTFVKNILINGASYNISYTKPAMYDVVFESNGGENIDSQSVYSGKKATRPSNPSHPLEYSFGGWFIDNETFLREYDFDTPVTEDLTLYAKWNSGTQLPSNVVFANKSTEANLSFAYRETIKENITINTAFIASTSNNTNATDRALDMIPAMFSENDRSYVSSITRKNNSAGTLPGLNGSKLVFYSSKTSEVTNHSQMDFVFNYEVSSIKVTYDSSVNTRYLSLIINEAVVHELENETYFSVNSASFTLKNCLPGDGSSANNNRITVTGIEFKLATPEYSNFRDVKIQFKSDFDCSTRDDVTESGIVVSSSSDFDFSSNKYNVTENDSLELTQFAENNGLKVKKYINDNFKSKNEFVVGISINSLSDCKKKLYAHSYIVVDGKYHFSRGANFNKLTGVSEGYSVLDMLSKYLTMEEISDYNKVVMNDFVSLINVA